MPQDPLIRFAALLLVLGAPGGAAMAQSCSFSDVPALAFGTYDPFGPQTLQADVPVAIACDTGNVAFTVGVAGASDGRTMARSGGGSAIAYTLLDENGTALGQDGASIGGAVDGSGDGTVRIYGEISPGQNVRPGLYGDTPMIILSLEP
jgi:spore coat protein U-like protein